MKHEATRELFRYWNGLRGGRSAPERSDIDPAAIRNVLADTFMLDVDVAGRFPVRLAGTRVNGLFDADQKGRSFLDLWRAEERRNVAAVLLAVADGASPVVAGASAAPRGCDEGRFELLFLPLRHFGKTHARILGLVTPATQPFWLGLLPVGPFALRSLRIIDDARAALAGSERHARCEVPPVRSSDGVAVDRGAPPALDDGATYHHARPRFRVIEGGRPQG